MPDNRAYKARVQMDIMRRQVINSRCKCPLCTAALCTKPYAIKIRHAGSSKFGTCCAVACTFADNALRLSEGHRLLLRRAGSQLLMVRLRLLFEASVERQPR